MTTSTETIVDDLEREGVYRRSVSGLSQYKSVCQQTQGFIGPTSVHSSNGAHTFNY